jgi:multiple sugar transport system permease protein
MQFTPKLQCTNEQSPVSYKVKKGIKQWLEVSPFILTGMILVGIFVVYPQIKSLWMSLTDYNIMDPKSSPFIGLANYMKATVGSEAPMFWLAFRNVILYAVVTVPLGMIIGLVLAVLVNSVKRGQLFYRSMLYLPVLIDWIVVSIIFLYLFQDGKSGLVNYYLIKLHLLRQPIAWLEGTWTANLVIWIFGIWKSVGWAMIIYLAGLQGIPAELYESAALDGASGVIRFLKITVPLIKSTTLFVLINLVIGAFNVFYAVFMLTQGGPIGTTDVLQNYMYTQAFSYLHFGYACAISVITGVSIFVLTLSRNKFFKNERN